MGNGSTCAFSLSPAGQLVSLVWQLAGGWRGGGEDQHSNGRAGRQDWLPTTLTMDSLAWKQLRRFLNIKLQQQPSRLFPFNNQLSIIREIGAESEHQRFARWLHFSRKKE